MAAYRPYFYIIFSFITLYLGQCVESSESLKVAAFNVRVFGRTKIQDTVVVERIVKIFSQYDLIFMQEIRDATEEAIYEVKDKLNTANARDPFQMKLSNRLGTTSQKEQYAYFYRPSHLNCTDSYHWEDPIGIYEREPFATRFTYLGSERLDFGFIGFHSKPDQSPPEIDALVEVYTEMTQRWEIKDFILGGDWNAGCRYVTDDDWEDIRLRHDSRFHWLIDDDTDTMLTSDCPYDRFVIAGDGMLASYVNGSAAVFRFDDDMGLTQEEAEDVSDHYPIELVMN